MKFARIFSDFLEKRCQLLEISRFQFDFSMIIAEIHLIFDLIFDLILFNFRFNFHIGTTPVRAGSQPGPRVTRVRKEVRKAQLAVAPLPSTVGPLVAGDSRPAVVTYV